MGLLTEFNANEELRRRIYGMTSAAGVNMQQPMPDGQPRQIFYKNKPIFEVTRQELELWKRSMDLERALWAIFNLESAVLRDLMTILNEFHPGTLNPHDIDRIGWVGEKGMQRVYEEKICHHKDVRLDLSNLPTMPERLRLYWNIRHQWVHRHGLVDATFRGPTMCEDLFAEGWFHFEDGRAWLRQDEMREILLSCVGVGRHILGQAIEKYPSMAAKLE
jgi:hypothetical protein